MNALLPCLHGPDIDGRVSIHAFTEESKVSYVSCTRGSVMSYPRKYKILYCSLTLCNINLLISTEICCCQLHTVIGIYKKNMTQADLVRINHQVQFNYGNIHAVDISKGFILKSF